MKITFSIVVPTFNRRELLPTAVESVVTQTWTEWELIVVDDGSTDDTAALFRQRFTDPRIHYFHQPNRGKSQARNRGLELAKGDYICFLDSDDYFRNDHLERLSSAIRAHHFPVAVFRTGMETRTLDNHLLRTASHYTPAQGTPIAFFARHMVGTPTLCLHRHIAKEFRFDPRFPYVQDTQFLFRVLRKHPIIQVPHDTFVCVHHRNRGGIAIFRSDRVDEVLKEVLAAIRAAFPDPPPPHEVPVLNYMITKKYYDFATACIAAGRYRQSWHYFRQSHRLHRGGLHMAYAKYLAMWITKPLLNYPRFP